MRTPTSMPSASRLQLAVTCPASQALPVVDSHHVAADEGSDLHELLRRAVMGEMSPDETQQRQPWLDDVLEAIGDRLVGAVAEQAFSFDPSTGNVDLLGTNIGRNYPRFDVINGSIDYVVSGLDKALVVDIKTGMSDVPPVRRNQQLRFAAFVAGSWLATPVQTAILHAPRDGRRPWWEYGPTYDALDLVEIGDTLEAMTKRIGYARKDVAAGKTPRLTVGSHCTYCPARLRCPAQTEAIKLWADEPVEMARDLERNLTVETAGYAWSRIEAVEAAVKSAKAALYAFASQQPFPLLDGRMMGKHRKQGRSEVDVEKLWPWLVERIGVDGAREAVTMKASKTSVRDAVGAHAARGQKRAAGDAAVRELEASGVIADKWTEEVGVYEPTETQSASVPALASTAGLPPDSSLLALSQPGVAAQETNQ